MDEILIGEKRYISSKQAAKETGYAKDYIGQLCREGRVPARLVGRSWYVLESAIHDHRFGDSKNDSPKEPASTAAASITSSWEAPRYAASETEILPQILPKESEPVVKHEETERMQDTWQAWFAKFEPAATEEKEPPTIAETPQEKETSVEMLEQDGTRIPIHTVYQLQHHIAPEEIVSPHIAVDTKERHAERTYPRRTTAGRWIMQIAGMSCAVFVTLLAILGTGYFDKYITSDSRVMLLAGVEIYNN